MERSADPPRSSQLQTCHHRDARTARFCDIALCRAHVGQQEQLVRRRGGFALASPFNSLSWTAMHCSPSLSSFASPLRETREVSVTRKAVASALRRLIADLALSERSEVEQLA